jgi:hypothetical protein
MMDLELFLELAKTYNNLGWSVQEQLESVVRGEPMQEQNSNALAMIASFLGGACDHIEGAGDLAEELEQYIEAGDFGEYGF